MPAPVVYFVVAGAVITTIAAGIAFKQLVYSPHIAPQFEAWKATKQRNRQTRRSGPIPVPATTEASEESEPLVPQRGRRDSDAGDGMSVELQDLVLSEQAEWQSGSMQNTLRQRRARNTNVLDESNVFVPYDPISPTTATSTASSGTNSPMSSSAGPSLYGMTQISSPPVIHSPLPRTPINPSRLQSNVNAESPSPRYTSPASTRAVITPRVVSPAESSTTASSFTPVVLGPSSPSSATARSVSRSPDIARSPTLDAFSPPRSRVASPFVRVGAASSPSTDASGPGPQRSISPALSPFADAHPPSPRVGYNRSPSPVLLSPPQSSLYLPSESDMANLSPSLRTAMFSPSMSSFDGHFEIDSSFDGSDDGSDGSWSNVRERPYSP